jgi:hypothetical protein
MFGGQVHIPSLCRTQSPKSAIYAETAHSYERDMSGNERAQTTIPREYQVPLRWPIRSSLPPTLRRDKPAIKPKRVGFEIGDRSALLCVKIEADSILDFNVKYY